MARAACPDRRLLESSLRGKARSMLFSNSVVDEFCEEATLPEMRAVEGLLARQMEVRAANQLERRMRRARFPAAKSLDGYDFSKVSFPDGYGEADLRSLAFADARDRGRLRRELDDLLSADLLVLDELGYVPLDVEGARLLFQVMSAPEGTQSLIVTTNIEFSRWGTVFGDDKMAAAVVDRLVYTGRLVEFNGASYRMENALMLGKGEAE